MKKLIKKIGTSTGITFSAEEKLIFDIAPGKIIEIEIKNTEEKKENGKE